MNQHPDARMEIAVHNQEAQCGPLTQLLRNFFLFHQVHQEKLYVLNYSKLLLAS